MAEDADNMRERRPGMRVHPGLARRRGVEPMVLEATTAETMERIVQFIAEDD